MPNLKIIMEGDSCWSDLLEKTDVINAMGEETQVSVAALAGGMSSGKTSITFRVDLKDGRVVLFETSLALLNAAVKAFKARYGE
jgi:hypothetical protein